MEERVGTITDVTRSLLRDNTTGESKEYVNPAMVMIQNSDEVIYVSIQTGGPGGKVINIIKQKKI